VTDTKRRLTMMEKISVILTATYILVRVGFWVLKRGRKKRIAANRHEPKVGSGGIYDNDGNGGGCGP